jgi:hypothetical protein
MIDDIEITGATGSTCDPATDLNVVYNGDCDEAVLTWTSPSAGATCNVYRDEVKITTVTTTTYTDASFDATKSHKWSVKVDCSGAESVEVAKTMPACDPIPGEFTYNIYRNDVLIGTVDTETYTDTSFDKTVAYTWSVKVDCENGLESAAVNKAMVACYTPCPVVTGAKAIIENCEKATITWTAAAGAAKYKIEREGVAAVEADASPYTEEFEFEKGKTYTWTITTICTSGEEAEGVKASAIAGCVGVNELANNIAIFPNPSNSTVTISAPDFAKVEVYNTVGQLVETRTVNIVDVSSYNTGVYFFKVYDSNNNSVTKRIMVTK